MASCFCRWRLPWRAYMNEADGRSHRPNLLGLAIPALIIGLWCVIPTFADVPAYILPPSAA